MTRCISQDRRSFIIRGVDARAREKNKKIFYVFFLPTVAPKKLIAPSALRPTSITGGKMASATVSVPRRSARIFKKHLDAAPSVEKNKTDASAILGEMMNRVDTCATRAEKVEIVVEIYRRLLTDCKTLLEHPRFRCIAAAKLHIFQHDVPGEQRLRVLAEELSQKSEAFRNDYSLPTHYIKQLLLASNYIRN